MPFKKRSGTVELRTPTDTTWRTYCQTIVSAILAVTGWTQTTDTGQANFATMLAPTAANQTTGYVMFDLPDNGVGGMPTFKIRIEFASSLNQTAGRALRFTVGVSTDGAGNFTSATWTFNVSCNDQQGVGGSNMVSFYACGNDSDLWFLMNPGTNLETFAFSFTRTKNNQTGANTPRGLSFASRGANGNTQATGQPNQYQALIGLGGTIIQAGEKFVVAVPAQQGSLPQTFAGPDSYVVYPTLEPYNLASATLNFLCYFRSDMPAPLTLQDVEINGVTYTWLASGLIADFNNNTTFHWLGNLNLSHGVMMPYQGATV